MSRSHSSEFTQPVLPGLRLFDPAAEPLPAPQQAQTAEGGHPTNAPTLSAEQLNAIALAIAAKLAPASAGAGKTVRDCWAVLRRVRTQKKSTVAEYERCLDRFEEFWVASYRTIRPVLLADVTETTLADFRDWLAAGDGETARAGTTVAKYFRSLTALLREGQQQRWIDRVPRKPQIRRAPKKQIRVIRAEVVTSLLERLRTAPPKYPAAAFARGVRPETWWRGLITLCWHFGFRRGEILERLTWRHTDPLLGPGPVGVFFQAQSPLAEIDLSNEHGWIVYSPVKQEWCKPGVLLLPLTACCRQVLQEIRQQQNLSADAWPHTLVFPGPNSHPARDRVFKSLQIAAGVALPYTLHDLRRTCETFWSQFGLGDFVTGHSSRTTSDNSYDQKVTRLIALYPSLAGRPDYPFRGSAT